MEFRDRAISAAVALTLVVISVHGALIGDVNATEEVEEESAWYNRSDTIYFWYTDEELTDYISKAAVDFGERENVHVLPVLVSADDYLEEINKASITNSQMPDAYLLPHESIEMAYLSGLATVVNDSEYVLSTENFSEAALNAVTYDDKLVGYPMFYNTVALLYNQVYLHDWAGQKALAVLTGEEDAFSDNAYFEEIVEEVMPDETPKDEAEGGDTAEGETDEAVQETTESAGADGITVVEEVDSANMASEDDSEIIPYNELSEEEKASVLAAETARTYENAIPKTMDDILTIADTFDAPVGVDGVMSWDVSNIMYNYWIIGDVLNIGGPAGDDKNVIQFNKDLTTTCLKYYQYLHTFFSIESKQVNGETVLKDFIDGKMMFTIANVDSVAVLREAYADGTMEFDYSYGLIPNISADIQSQPMSMTTAVMINGYSEKQDIANAFARYLVTEYASELYTRTGHPSCNLYGNSAYPELFVFDAEYARSVPLPKIIELENFWMELEALFARVWNDADVETELAELQDTVRMYFVTEE